MAIFIAFGWFVTSGVPTEKDKRKAKIITTMLEERLMADLLSKQAVKLGGMTNLPYEFIAVSLHNTNESQYPFQRRTNSSGQFIDIWQTPFQINLVGRTDFIIRSAGPNLKFDDEDDIVFNNVTNSVGKP